MEKDSTINFSENYQNLTPPLESNGRKNKFKLFLCFALLVVVVHSTISIFFLKAEVEKLQKSIFLLEMKAEVDVKILKNIQAIMYSQLQREENNENSEYKELHLNDEENSLMENDEPPFDEDEANQIEGSYNDNENDDNNNGNSNDNDDDLYNDDEQEGDNNFGFKRKREIRDYNESSQEKNIKNETDNKSKIQKFSTESSSSVERSSEFSSKEKLFPTSNIIYSSSTRKPHFHRKHRKSRIGSAERFFTETHSTTSTPIQVRQSRTKVTQMQGIDKTIWLQNQKTRNIRKGRGVREAIRDFQLERSSAVDVRVPGFIRWDSAKPSPSEPSLSRSTMRSLPPDTLTGPKETDLNNHTFQQHTSPHKDTITKEEALRKGYGRHLEDVTYDLETSKERIPDALSYNMIMIHFSADTSHYSRERDPHYFGNGRMQIKSEVYKDWKPAHWTQGVGMSKYFHLHQGRVTVSTTGIYLIYAQIQYSNVQEVNGFSVFRNKEVVVQCITTSTHPDKHEIKSNTCGISTTILLQSNDSVCIKDLHHGRYVVLTPEKSYFGLVLLSPFKN